jgi:hypothetical protein
MSISVAAELGIADLLAGGDKTAEELAEATSAHAPSLYRLLRALSSVGIFAEGAGGRFTLTPLAQCLRRDAPDSMRNCALLFGLPMAWGSWGEFRNTIRTGETGMKTVFGITDGFEYLSQHPEEAAIFDGAMTDYTRQNAPAIAAAYDFGRFRKLVDIAGGHGLLLSTVLRRYRGVRGVVFDLPHVIEGAKQAIAEAGLTSRCDAVAGSFFEAVPEGADGYMLKSIIHDWDDERALAILRNIRRAIRPEGRLLLLENVIPTGNGPSFGKWLDLEMLVLPGGRERTEAEYRDLFAAAGFRLTGVTPTACPASVIEGMPVAE